MRWLPITASRGMPVGVGVVLLYATKCLPHSPAGARSETRALKVSPDLKQNLLTRINIFFCVAYKIIMPCCVLELPPSFMRQAHLHKHLAWGPYSAASPCLLAHLQPFEQCPIRLPRSGRPRLISSPRAALD